MDTILIEKFIVPNEQFIGMCAVRESFLNKLEFQELLTINYCKSQRWKRGDSRPFQLSNQEEKNFRGKAINNKVCTVEIAFVNSIIFCLVLARWYGKVSVTILIALCQRTDFIARNKLEIKLQKANTNYCCSMRCDAMNEVPAEYNVQTHEISHQKRIEKQLIKSQFAVDRFHIPIATFCIAYSTIFVARQFSSVSLASA